MRLWSDESNVFLFELFEIYGTREASVSDINMRLTRRQAHHLLLGLLLIYELSASHSCNLHDEKLLRKPLLHNRHQTGVC